MKLRIVGAILALILLASSALAHAQSSGGPPASLGAGYDLEWNTIDNGGAAFATGGGYELGGTIGQPDAVTWQGGGYTLSGGFWLGGGIPVTPAYPIYLPLVVRNSA